MFGVQQIHGPAPGGGFNPGPMQVQGPSPMQVYGPQGYYPMQSPDIFSSMIPMITMIIMMVMMMSILKPVMASASS